MGRIWNEYFEGVMDAVQPVIEQLDEVLWPVGYEDDIGCGGDEQWEVFV